MKVVAATGGAAFSAARAEDVVAPAPHAHTFAGLAPGVMLGFALITHHVFTCHANLKQN